MDNHKQLPTEKQYFDTALEKSIIIDEEKRIVDGVIGSTGLIDRQGESINPEGWSLDNFKKNPIILFGHDYYSLPIGKALKVWVEEGKLMFTIKFSSKPFAQDVFDLIKEGMLNAVSVGFIPLKWDEKGDYTFAEQELLELSVVPVPANPEALIANGVGEKITVQKHVDGILSRMAEIVSKDEKKEEPKEDPPQEAETKSVVSYDATEKADEGMEWDGTKAKEQLAKFASSDGSGDKSTIDWGKYAKGFTWFDSENKEKFGSYKLPHHYADGSLTVVWNGVKAAMGALLGARGGTKIPDADRKGVYNHLSKHYAQFEKEVPEFKEYSVEELFELDQKGIIDIGQTVELSKDLFAELVSQSKELATLKENHDTEQKEVLEAVREVRKLLRPSNYKLSEALGVLKNLLKPSDEGVKEEGGEKGTK